jgi:DNA polymerase-1
MVTVLVLDAYNLLFRSFATLPSSITDQKDQPINAVYGLLGGIIKMMRDLQPARIVAAFDVPEVPTFRHRAYPSYQAQRGPLGGEKAEDFACQVSIAEQILPALGVPALSQPGYEADDVMGTVARGVQSRSGAAILVSTDRDLLQLVGNGIEIVVPGAAGLRIQDAQAVRERIGVTPEHVPTFKSLAGDASDNIPGVPGIGPKTAVSLVETYGSLENLYDHLDELPRRSAAALDAGREMAFLFRHIATIVTNLELAIDLGDLPAPEITAESKVRDLLNKSYSGDR